MASRRNRVLPWLAILANVGMVLPGAAGAQAPTAPPEHRQAILVGGYFADGRIVALDTAGELVRTGAGQGFVRSGSVCPGGETLVESGEIVAEFPGQGAPFVAVRDVATFEVVDELDPRGLFPEGNVQALRCLKPDGTEVAVFMYPEGIGIVGDSPRVVSPGSWRLAGLGPAHAVVVPEKEVGEVRVLDYATGRDVLLYRPGLGPDELWDVHSVAFSPSGRMVAIVDWRTAPTPAHTLRIFEVASGRLVGQAAFPGHHGTTTASWVGDSELLVAAIGEDPTSRPSGDVVLVDTSGRETARWGGSRIIPAVVTDDRTLLGYPISSAAIAIAAGSVDGGPQGLVRSFETLPIQGVHGPFPAPVTIVGTLEALDGSLLLGRVADAPEPGREASQSWLVLASFAAVVAVGAALAWWRVRIRGAGGARISRS